MRTANLSCSTCGRSGFKSRGGLNKHKGPCDNTKSLFEGIWNVEGEVNQTPAKTHMCTRVAPQLLAGNETNEADALDSNQHVPDY
jgi:hypothetical protein